MRIFDISPLVTQDSPVYPGDAPLRIKRVSEAPALVSAFGMSPHLGAHVDAPAHLHAAGEVADLSLNRLLGSAQVLALSVAGEITPQALQGKPIVAERLLLKTGFRLGTSWPEQFPYLSAESVDYLNQRHVRLIGIDTPSIDAAESEALPSHRRAVDAGMLILENLDLAAVGEGLYELIALPLKIRGLEASPVRAVLVESF